MTEDMKRVSSRREQMEMEGEHVEPMTDLSAEQIEALIAAAPKLTTSIDAALALVERVLPGAVCERTNMKRGKRGGFCTIHALSSPVLSSFDIHVDAEAATEPLAICIALLKAHGEGE